MKTIQLIAVVIAMLSAAILYMPSPFYRKSEKLARDKFIETYPQFAWLRWLYPLIQGLMALWALITVMIILIKFGESMGGVAFYFLGLFLCVPSIFDGGVAVFTGVRPVPNPGGYLFVYEEGTYLISWMQIVLSLAIVAFVAVSAFF